ncbi:MAG TPA: type VI secretion system tube protein Hcp [Thermoanaerobaculia bacterium]|nr:type VI secretion system tube protein Hcp [Thermoanaerobaculia bacterium]
MKRLFLAAVILSVTPAFAAYDIFLKLGDIKGESTDKDHKDWIELSSYRLSPTRGVKEVTLQGPMRVWTNQVELASAGGRHLTNVVLDAGPMRFTFDEVWITSYSTSGAGGLRGPEATFTLAYRNSTMTMLQRPNTPPAPPALVAATIVNANVQPAPANAQVFVDGMPSDRFTLMSFERRGNIGVLNLRNVQGNGYFAASKKKNNKVNVKASAGQFLEIQMTDCTISSYTPHADGTATATLNFSAYTGPITVRP